MQQAIHLVFAKMQEFGSARQVLLWFRGERVSLPVVTRDRFGKATDWKLPVFHSILAILTNPMYAGAYAFGKTEARTKMVDGRVHKTIGHKKLRPEWMVLIRDHHPGYISWEHYEHNQVTLAENTHRHFSMDRKSGRGGRSLLAGLLRCRRCGRMLHVTYSGSHGEVPRYHCRGAHINHGEGLCISFGGLRPDQAVADEILKAIAGNAIEAALAAAERIIQEQHERRQVLSLELEQARYQEQMAARRYEAVDPAYRLVAAELESRWNAAMQAAADVATKLEQFERESKPVRLPDKESLVSMAQDLPAIWKHPTSDMKLKQRIVRILIREIVADVDEQRSETILLIHWAGGRHSELRVKRNGSGKHSRCTSLEAVEIVRRMAGVFSDQQIAATLNRLGLRTGAGNTWVEGRVRSLRSYHELPACSPDQTGTGAVTLEQAAQRLGIAVNTVRRLIEEKVLAAYQVVPCAPWQIPSEALASEAVLQAVMDVKNHIRRPRSTTLEGQRLLFSGM